MLTDGVDLRGAKLVPRVPQLGPAGTKDRPQRKLMKFHIDFRREGTLYGDSPWLNGLRCGRLYELIDTTVARTRSARGEAPRDLRPSAFG
jgi:hypothetical protein